MSMFAAVPYVYREEEERRIMHYSSSHHILLVGDGDFSFSLCLALAFGNASFIVATSLDSYDMLMKKYKQAHSNIEILKFLGATVLHGVDANEMRSHTDLCLRKFDCIIFNFPHAGFYGKEDNTQLIKMHRSIVKGFFRNASGMLHPYGQIHVNHKTTAPFCHWNIEELAKESSLLLIDCVQFKKEDYPGYNNKRGAGTRSDEPFPLGQCSTYKFVLNRINTVQRIPLQALYQNVPVTSLPRVTEMPFMGYTQRSPLRAIDQNIPVTFLPRVTTMPFMGYVENIISSIGDEILRIFSDYFNHVIAPSGRLSYDIYFSTQKCLRICFEIYREESGGDLNGYIRLLHELGLFHVSRMANLGIMSNFDCQLRASRALDDIISSI